MEVTTMGGIISHSFLQLFHRDFDYLPLNRDRSWLMEVQLHLNIMIRPKPMQWYIVSTVLIRLATVGTGDREDDISSASLLSGRRVKPCSDRWLVTSSLKIINIHPSTLSELNKMGCPRFVFNQTCWAGRGG